MLYSDAIGVEHTDSGSHNSGNKSSGRMNRHSPNSKPPDAFLCGERPKKHLLQNASCRLLSMEMGPLCCVRAFGDGPRNFEPWSSDEDDTRVGTPSPNYHTSPMGGRLSSRQI
ncbi:hypothetical protein TNCV_2103541 [Trichonephila clavipes]|nr:hypothetical protein TNCV_2103541 [Trichonephila clavipes]